LIDLILNEKINPGKVFDLVLPFEQVAEGYGAMDERRDQGAGAAVSSMDRRGSSGQRRRRVQIREVKAF
jgi:hypothetical protein